MNLEDYVEGNKPAPHRENVTKICERGQHICTPRLCSVFGGHDTNYYLEDSCSPRSRQKNRNLNTLGSPVGVVKSSLGVKSIDGNGDALKFATCLKALAKIFLIPERSWDSAAMDQLLKEGQLLLTQSNEAAYVEEDQPSDVYTETEAKVKRSFELDGYSFRMELNTKFDPQPNAVERSGDARTEDLKLEFIRPTLKSFFRQAKYCLATISTWYLLIWKAKGIFFIFDFNGRRLNDFVSDREKGQVMLICLKTLDNVCHLIENLSGVEKTATFNLREMKVIRLSGPDIGTKNREHGKRVNQYEVISADYAFLKSSLHLSLKREKPLRSRSALAVTVAALLASKIEHPATWDQKILDKIICYGFNVFMGCLEQHTNGPIECFPNQLRIGQFSVNFTLTLRTHEGIWKCVPSYKQSELAIAIEKSFKAGDSNIIVQIDQQMYAIWKKNSFIYFFDPYRHRMVATLNDPRSASLRIFRTLDMLLSVFNQILLDSNITSSFFVHSLKIKNIQLANKAEGVAEEKRRSDEEDEAMSLNEATICFEDDDTKCRDELEQISDYEEDDITTDVMRMAIEEPESETDESEEGMEEVEGGPLEDLGEYESSSSGSGDDDALSGKKKKKGTKNQRDKKKSKGGKQKDIKSKQKAKGKDTDKKLIDENQKEDKNKDEIESSDKKLEDKSQKKSEDDKNKLEEKNKKDKDEQENKKRKEEEEIKKMKEEEEIRKKKEEEENRKKEEEERKKKELDENQNKEGDDEDEDEGEEDSQKKKEEDEMKKKKEIEEEKENKNEEDEIQQKKAEEESKKRKLEEERQKKETLKPIEEQKKRQSNRKKPHESCKEPSFKYGLSGIDGDDDHMKEQYKPNHYPGYSHIPSDMAVVVSESGSYESITKLLRAGFKCADRILMMTPWGNYVAFRSYNMYKKIYFLFDGCTCNSNRFRHLDLNCGTAGLLFFDHLPDVTSYIIDSRKIRTCMQKSRKHIIDEICRKYC